MSEHIEDLQVITFTDRLRLLFKGIIEPIANFLNQVGLRPNTMTILGLVGTTIGAYLVSQGNLVPGAIVIGITGLFDALDGTMARLRGEAGDWGAFVDSVTDRYGELVIHAGLIFYFLQQENHLGTMLTYAAAAGAILVSYTKARAESLNYQAKIGLLSRVERYLVLVPLLFFERPMIAVSLLAFLNNISALQRIFFVRRQAYQKDK